jgi:heptaprenyl diphosphate synthase
MPDRQRLITLHTTPEDHRIAQLAAAAIGLSLIDAAIPMPLPGVKPGLANIVTLIVLARYGWVAAAWVSGLRVFAGSLLLGYFLSPGFFMSLSGALCSLLTLAWPCACRTAASGRSAGASWPPLRISAGNCCWHAVAGSP